MNKDFEYVPEYLQSLSEIMTNLQSPSLNELNTLTKLSILLIKKFSELHISTQNNVISALKSTFVNISKLERRFQQEYFFGTCKN